jgi:hypothetical protein
MNTEDIVNYMTTLAIEKNTYCSMVEKEYFIDEAVLFWLNSENIKFKITQHRRNPEVRLEVFCDSYTGKGYNIQYNYILYFSKFLNVFKDEIQFRIKNPDETNYAGDSFMGEESMPLTSKQEIIVSKLKSMLIGFGFTYLSYRDYSTVICNLNYVVPEMKLYGNQPTVGILLFHDFFDLLT